MLVWLEFRATNIIWLEFVRNINDIHLVYHIQFAKVQLYSKFSMPADTVCW